MTPLDLAANLAKSDDPKSRALAVAIVLRGLTDDDPATLRQGWPLTDATAIRAASYVGLDPAGSTLIADALALAPTLSDAILNRPAY